MSVITVFMSLIVVVSLTVLLNLFIYICIYILCLFESACSLVSSCVIMAVVSYADLLITLNKLHKFIENPAFHWIFVDVSATFFGAIAFF